MVLQGLGTQTTGFCFPASGGTVRTVAGVTDRVSEMVSSEKGVTHKIAGSWRNTNERSKWTQ